MRSAHQGGCRDSLRSFHGLSTRYQRTAPAFVHATPPLGAATARRIVSCTLHRLPFRSAGTSTATHSVTTRRVTVRDAATATRSVACGVALAA